MNDFTEGSFNGSRVFSIFFKQILCVFTPDLHNSDQFLISVHCQSLLAEFVLRNLKTKLLRWMKYSGQIRSTRGRHIFRFYKIKILSEILLIFISLRR